MSKLGDVAEVRGRVGWKGYTVEDLTDNGPLVLGANDITSDNRLNLTDVKHLTREKYEESPEIFVELNDVLVVKVGSTIGKVCIIDDDIGEASINPNCVIVRAKKINPYYLYYYLCTPTGRAFLINNSVASGQPALNQTNLKKLEIPEMEQAEQNKIIETLNTIKRCIVVNERIIKMSEKLMHEIYNYWFVQFDFPDENGRPYKSSGGEMVYDETLKREIPKGWSVKRVDELCEVKTGKEDANFSVPDGDYKFFTCADEPLRCNTPCFSGKSILIAGNGNFNVKHYDGDFNAYQRTYVLQPDDEFYGITFIEAKNKTALFAKGSNGSIVKFITKGDVGSIHVLTSHKAIELYETFNTILAEIDVLQSENEKLASLRDWLLPMLMNGQIKVSD